MPRPQFDSFGDFYAYYLDEHTECATRITHFVGTGFFLMCGFLMGILLNPWLFPIGVLGAYFCAWIGHFVFERNRPATFSFPLWSLIADFRMFFELCLRVRRFRLCNRCKERALA
ncbi:MAG: DUF962 domain-containing protein [Planctomycetota bacterium]